MREKYGRFGQLSATLSPGWIPLLTRKLATMLATMSTSAYVIRRPVAGKTIASRSG